MYININIHKYIYILIYMYIYIYIHIYTHIYEIYEIGVPQICVTNQNGV